MSTPKKGERKPPKADDRSYGGGGKGGGDQQPPPQGPGNPDADPQRIHREFVERRLGGGAPATRDAYSRAIDQWHKLPGAVVTPVSEVKIEPKQNPKQDEGAESNNNARDGKRGS